MRNRNIVAGLVAGVMLALAVGAEAKEWPGFTVGMGMGGWLTNYKRFNVLPMDKRLAITKGDLAHFDTYITEGDVARIKMWGFDHIRLGFCSTRPSCRTALWRSGWRSSAASTTRPRSPSSF